MDENTFWCRIWGYIVALVMVVVLSMAGCQMHQNKLFVEGGYCSSPLRGSDQPWIKCDSGFSIGPSK